MNKKDFIKAIELLMKKLEYFSCTKEELFLCDDLIRCYYETKIKNLEKEVKRLKVKCNE